MRRFYRNARFHGFEFPDMSNPETLDRRYANKVDSIALSFMKSLLQIDPRDRLSGADCLNHKYFEKYFRGNDIQERNRTISPFSRLNDAGKLFHPGFSAPESPAREDMAVLRQQHTISQQQQHAISIADEANAFNRGSSIPTDDFEDDSHTIDKFHPQQRSMNLQTRPPTVIGYLNPTELPVIRNLSKSRESTPSNAKIRMRKEARNVVDNMNSFGIRNSKGAATTSRSSSVLHGNMISPRLSLGTTGLSVPRAMMDSTRSRTNKGRQEGNLENMDAENHDIINRGESRSSKRSKTRSKRRQDSNTQTGIKPRQDRRRDNQTPRNRSEGGGTISTSLTPRGIPSYDQGYYPRHQQAPIRGANQIDFQMTTAAAPLYNQQQQQQQQQQQRQQNVQYQQHAAQPMNQAHPTLAQSSTLSQYLPKLQHNFSIFEERHAQQHISPQFHKSRHSNIVFQQPAFVVSRMGWS